MLSKEDVQQPIHSILVMVRVVTTCSYMKCGVQKARDSVVVVVVEVLGLVLQSTPSSVAVSSVSSESSEEEVASLTTPPKKPFRLEVGGVVADVADDASAGCSSVVVGLAAGGTNELTTKINMAIKYGRITGMAKRIVSKVDFLFRSDSCLIMVASSKETLRFAPLGRTKITIVSFYQHA
jgi:hypothetical protein